MTSTRERAPEFPPGVDGFELLRPCYHPLWAERSEYGAAYRRAVTRLSPLLFAVTYLGPVFARYEGIWSFSDLHLGMAEIGRAWVRPGGHRDVVVAPRGAAKSVWAYLVLPLWALGHGHRRFFLAFSASREQVLVRLQDVRTALDTMPLIAHDYPELRPRSNRGARNTMHHVTASGATIAGRGIGESVLGARSMAERPDLILLDDVEPDETVHNAATKAKLLSKITTTILPMNNRAATLMVGTTTMPGSLTHDAVRAAAGRPGLLADRGGWVAAQRFRPHHFPAILDEGSAGARSLWPRKWSLAELEAIRAADGWDWGLNYACDPGSGGRVRLWTAEDYRYARGTSITHRVLSIDGAVTRKATSDRTAIVVAGQGSDSRKVVLEHAEQGRINGRQLRERVWAYHAMYPRTLRTVLVETNQGGAMWRELLEPLPDGVELIEYRVDRAGGTKRQRIEAWHREYDRGAVLHATRLPELEDQQTAWTPAATEDDLLDAGAAATRRLLHGTAGTPDQRNR